MQSILLPIQEFLTKRRLVVYPALLLLAVYAVVFMPGHHPRPSASLVSLLLLFGCLFLFILLATNRFAVATCSVGLAGITTLVWQGGAEALHPSAMGFNVALFSFCLITGTIRYSQGTGHAVPTLITGVLPVLWAAPCLALAVSALRLDDPFMAFRSMASWMIHVLLAGTATALIVPVIVRDFFLPRDFPLLVRPVFFSMISALGVYLGIGGHPVTGALLIFYGLYKVGELRLGERTKMRANRMFSRIFAVMICLTFVFHPRVETPNGKGELFVLAFLVLWLLGRACIVRVYRPVLRLFLAHRMLPLCGLGLPVLIWGYETFFYGQVSFFQGLAGWMAVTFAVIGFALFFSSGKEILIVLAAGCLPLMIHDLYSVGASREPLIVVALVSVLCAAIQVVDLRLFVGEGTSIPQIRERVEAVAGQNLNSALSPFAVAFGSVFLWEHLCGASPLHVSAWAWIFMGLNLWIVPVWVAWTRELEYRKQDVMKDVYRTRQEKP